MKKILFLILLPIFLFSIDNKIYKVGVLEDWKPYYHLNKEGKHTGFAIELFEEVAKESNIKYEYIVAKTWQELLNLGINNKIDLIPNLGITKKRSNIFIFSQPTDTFYISLYKRKNSKNIKLKEDIKNKKIGVYRTNVCNSLIKENEYKNKIVFDDIKIMIGSLELKKIDALCYPKTILDYLLISLDNKKTIETFDKPLSEVKRGIAITNQNFNLLTKINDAITNIKINGKYNNLYFKWFGNIEESFFTEKQIKILLIGLSLIIVVILFFILWNKRLKIEFEKQKILKLQLDESKKKYEAIFKSNSTVSLLINPTTCMIIDANESALEYYGYSVEEILKLNLFDITNLDEIEIKINIQKALKKSISFEREHILSNKEIREVRIFSSPIEIEGKKLLFAQVFDITEQKKNEIQLQQALLVFENTNDGITITDKENKIININKAFTLTTGYTKNEVLGLNPNILRSKVNDEKFYIEMWKSINLKGFWRGEIRNRHKSGKSYDEILTINTLYNSNKKIIGYIGIFSDITKQKNDERIIYRQNKLSSMGEMIENIAHQWRQPLSSITTAATGAKLQKEMDCLHYEDLDTIFDTINDSAQYLSLTIDNFRSFFSSNSTEIREIMIEDCLSKALDFVNPQFTSKDIEIIKDIKNYKFLSIEYELIQVLINLFNNARDVLIMKENNRKLVFIKTYTKGNFLYIEIKDNGGGVNESIIDRIFEPYFTTKHQSIGIGIGLYMSEEIVKNHLNGFLEVENETYIFEDTNYTGAKFTIKINKD